MTPMTAPTPTVPPILMGQSGEPSMVALDIDGTLTAERRTDVPTVTADAVAAARRAGHHIVLASGRSLAGVLSIVAALGLDNVWVIASNGAIIARIDRSASAHGYTVADGDALHVDVLAVTTAVMQLRLRGLEVAAENVGEGYFVTELFPAGLLRGTQTRAPRAALEALRTPRVVLRAPGVHNLIQPLRAVGLTATPAGPDWLDVTPGGVSKATALETVRERLGVDRARTVAVGDGVNDIEALEWAARGVAMGHAAAEVRAAADEVTGSLTQHGAAAVLRSLPTAITTAR